MSDGQHSLVHRSWSLRMAAQGRIAAAVATGEDRDMKLFGVGVSAINSRLGSLERATRSSVYNLQTRIMFDPLRRERTPNEHSRLRRIRGHLITSDSHNARHLSILAACHPETWVGQVEASGLVIDERLALFPGPLSAQGLPTAWLCRDPDLVAELCDLWTEIKRTATPIRDVSGLVRITERQLDIISLLSQGHKDATIARLLGVSVRTVTSDVSTILDSLGVGTRWEGGLVLGQISMPI
jgi:DNA-binding CsgD family transcriptional regulator